MPADNPRQRRPRARSSAATPSRPMVHVYLPVDLHKQLLAWEDDQGLTHADVVLDAVEAHHETLLRPDQPEEPPPGGLFVRPRHSSRRTTSALDERSTVTVGLRLQRSDLVQIDRLVSASTTTSRSAYIVAALHAHLERIALQEEQ